jgi:hypothetical protein
MVDVRNTIAGWEKKQAPLSDDLQRFLDLVWSHRKRQDKPDPKKPGFWPGSYKAENADVYGLYARIHRNFWIGPAAMIGFLNGILSMTQLPELQCDPEDDTDALGHCLGTYFNAQRAPSGFASLDRQNFTKLVNVAGDDQGVRDALAKTFYHFRRNLADCADRIYLHVKPSQAITVMQYICKNMLHRPDVHPGLSNAKVGAPGPESRFDTIVIYLANATAVTKALDKIAGYQHEGKRVFFEPGTTRTTKLITNHKGIELVGVGTGAEPPVALRQHNQNLLMLPGSSSFGSFRSELIQFALANTMQHGEGKTEFVNRVVGYFKFVGINPQQPHTHGIQSELQQRARATLRQLRGGIEPTWKVS